MNDFANERALSETKSERERIQKERKLIKQLSTHRTIMQGMNDVDLKGNMFYQNYMHLVT